MEAYNIFLVLDFVILIILILTATGVVLSTNLLTATLLLSIFSFLMASQYLVLGAPDVAITEAAVGAGISTILFLLAIFIVGKLEKPKKSNFIVPVIVVLASSFALFYATSQMPEFGDISAPAHSVLSEYFINNSENDTGIPNIVTSILASYRGYDTFGETIVIFTAGISIILLLFNFNKED